MASSCHSLGLPRSVNDSVGQKSRGWNSPRGLGMCLYCQLK